MKIYIKIPGDTSQKQIIHFKKYLDKASIRGLRKIQFEKTPVKKGEMAVTGGMGALSAVLMGSVNPFTRVVQSFTKYTSSFRTELILKNEHGDEIVLNTKKLDKESIQILVDKFLSKK